MTSDASAGIQTSPGTTQAKVDYNGIKGVPTGPKQTPTTKGGAKSLAPIDPQVTLRPHIFISAGDVPAAQKTRPHLHKYLRSFIPREEDIFVDATGWYLCFEDTDSGRMDLATCFERHNKSKLFSVYTMHMECYPHGRADVRGQHKNGDVLTPVNNVAEPSPPDAASTAAQNFLDDLSLSFQASSPMDLGTESAAVASSFAGPLTSPLPPQVAIHLQRSSPLSVPSRQERDDTASSISGITGSDISASKRLNCHVCQKTSTFEIDQPIRCSSCPRRYHRRCHPRPAIPFDLGEDHHWQCRRCVRKQVPLKSRLSNTSAPNVDYSPAASVGQPDDDPLLKSLRVDISPPDLVRDPVLSANGFISPSVDDISGLTNQPRVNGELDLSDADDTYEPADMPIVNSDEHNLTEANDLVAKSFASLEATAQSPAEPSKKSGKLKLNLIRKKIVRTPEHNAAAGASDLQQPSNSSTGNVATRSAEQSGLAESPPTVSLEKSIPHEESRGGADKHIIEPDADDRFFKPISLPAHSNERLLNTSKNAAEVEHGVVLEIAESPEEARKSTLRDHTDSRSARVNFGEGNVKDKGLMATPTVAVTSKITNQSPFVQRASAVKPRMKPSTPAMSQCLKCDKKIAAMPSGNNIYCSRCKKGFSEESNALFRISASERQEADTERSQPDPDPSKASAGVDETTPTLTSAVQDSTNVHSHVQPASIPTPTKSAVPEGTRPAFVDAERGNDGSESDLDFWKAKDPEPDDIYPTAASPGPAAEIEVEMELDEDADGAQEMDEEQPNSDAHSDTPLVDEGTPEETDRDSPTGDAADSPQSKRRSQTRPAKGTYDLGDSYSRPPNTYVKLIGMALCSAPGHRLKGNDIVQWVLDNVPSYKTKEGKWENSLRATLTLKKAGYGGGEGLWVIVEDGSKKNEGFTYELLPGKADTMLHWDPVLRQPISPPKGSRTQHTSKERAGDVRATAKRLKLRKSDSKESATRPLSHRSKQPDGLEELESTNRPQMQLDTPDESISAGTEMDRSMRDDASSSSEPIARVRQKAKVSPTTSVREQDIEMRGAGASIAASLPTEIKELISADVGRFSSERPPMEQRSCKVTIEDMIAAEAKNKKFTVKNLFDEWPEYDPKNQIDREAKIAEIKARPTRKQKFGKQDNSVELNNKGPISRYVFGEGGLPERPKRTRPTAATAYPWEEGEENVIQVHSIAELFNLPANPVAFIHEGELAYKDASKPRIIYKC